MKRLIILIAIFAFGVLFMVGCKSPQNTNSIGNNSGDSASVKADAGEDKIVNLFTTDGEIKEILLDGSLSKGAVAYQWMQTENNKPTVILEDKTCVAKFIPTSEGAYKFILTITDKNGVEYSDGITVTVQRKPDIYLRTPVINETAVFSNKQFLDVSGQYDKGIINVSAINYTNGKNFDGKCDNAYYFKVSDIELSEGDNDIEVIGLDKAGEFSKRKLLVIYNKNIKFLSAPVFSKNFGYDNETTFSTISITINHNVNVDDVKVNLVEIDDNLQIINDKIATLYTNGNIQNSDKKSFDVAYSGEINFVNPPKGIHKYRVAINKDGVVYYSVPVEFTSLTSIVNTEEFELATDAIDKVIKDYDTSNDKNLTKEELFKKRQMVVQELLLSPYIETAELSSDNTTIWIKLNSGMETFIIFELSKKNSYRNEEVIKQKVENYDNKVIPTNTNFSATNAMKRYQPGPMKEAEQIGSYKAKSLSPFEYHFTLSDDVYGAYNEILESKTPKFHAETPKLNFDVTVEDFMGLSPFEVIIISTHGGYDKKNNTTLIPLTEEATKIKKNLYRKYLDEATIIHGGVYVPQYKEVNGKVILNGEKTILRDVFAITPAFITKYSGKMPNSIISLGSCGSFKSLKLEKAFKNNGAGLVIGYDNDVSSWYAHNIGLNFFRAMIRGKNAGEAEKNAKNFVGKNDMGNPPAYFITDGNDTLVLETSGIKNGGFEDRDTFWTSNEMNINVNSFLPDAIEGKNRAVNSLAGAYISQRFKVPKSAQYIAFSNFNFAQANVSSSSGWDCDGQFRALLINESGDETVIGGYDFINIAHEIYVYGNGQDSWYRTDWKTIEYPVSNFAGEYVTLKFTLDYVLYSGSRICRNEIHIDNVNLY